MNGIINMRFATEDGANDDLKHGLPVVIFARWLLVIAGLALALWNPADLVSLQVTVVVILGLAVGNFFLHVETSRNRPIKDWIVYGASAIDLIAITVVLGITGGFPTTAYVFYVPALLALSVTFPTRSTALYTVAAMTAYLVVSLTAIAGAEVSSHGASALVTHMVTLAAVPFCGNIYWRLERDRREREHRAEVIERQVTQEFDSIDTRISRVGGN